MHIAMFYLAICIILLVGIFMCLIYWYQIKNFNYWKNQGVPYIKPHWFFGSFCDVILKNSSWNSFGMNVYKKYKSKGFVGVFMFRLPGLYVLNSQLIQTLLVEDFIHFHDRATPQNPYEPLSNSLYNVKGEKWRTLRYKLIPTFTSGKVRGMYDQMLRCTDYIIEQIEENSKQSKETEVEQLLFVFITNVIASCTFGVELQSDSYVWNSFINAVNLTMDSSPWRVTKASLAIIYPRIVKLFNIRINKKDVSDFFVNLTKSTIRHREQNNIKRNDFLQLMLTLKEQEKSECEITVDKKVDSKNANQFHNFSLEVNPSLEESVFSENCIASLMFSFVASGTYPTIGTLSYALYELSRNIHIQKYLQKEVDTCIAKHGGLKYEAVKDMVYLDQIIQETLRLYTINPIIHREVTKPYKLPGTNVTLEAGMFVCIPLNAIHMDPEYYPSPEQFIPNRFAGNNFKPSSHFLPFGHGPRICIAIKFAVLMMKVCLAKIMSKYTVKLNSKTQVPLEFDEKELLLRTKDGMRLLFCTREQVQ